MNPRLAKVVGDLRESPARALLVMLAILIGTAALTAALGARDVLEREIATSFASGHPAAAILTLDSVDDRLLAAARSQPGVTDADSRRLVRARVEVAPGDWRPLLLFGVRDFADLRVSTFRPVDGDWPPHEGEVLVEQSALPVIKRVRGETLAIRLPGGRSATVRVGGIVHDPGLAPGWQDNAAYAYASPATLSGLGLGGSLDELRVTVDGDREAAAGIAGRLSEWARMQGRRVDRVEVTMREHPHADHMRSMLLLLLTFGSLALLLSGALTANVVAGLLVRQVRQIGIMKAVGGRSRQIAAIYLSLVALLAVPAIGIGLSLGALGARTFAAFAATQLNITLASDAITPVTLWLATLFALGVPFVAAAVPLRRALGVTVRQALQPVGAEWPNWRTKPGAFGDRTMTLAVRNSVRRPARLALTLGALALGGGALITGVNVYASLIAAVDRSLAARSDDLDLRLLRPVPADTLAARIRAIPGVTDVEPWGATLAAVALSTTGQAAALGTERYGVLAPPADTRMLRAPMAAGRWPARIGEVAVNRALLAREPELTIGRNATLLDRGRSVPVTVVGLVEEVAEPHFYTTPATFDALMGASGLAGGVRVATESGHTLKVAAAAEDVVVDLGSLPVFSMTKDALRASMVDHFAILLALLSIAAGAAILVGGLGLAATMGLNVIERTREIGILRAIGARHRAVLGIIFLEGFAIAAASSVFAILIGLPLSWAVDVVIGRYGLHADLPFIVQPMAIVGWVAIAGVVTFLACLAPARRALRLPPREALAYE